MFPHPETVIRVNEARHHEALTAATRDRLIDGSRAEAVPRPVVTNALWPTLGAALVRVGERLGAPSRAAAPARLPAR